MTPFGDKLRQLRDARGLQLKDMAAALKVSPAYLSALEHGHRGRPSGGLVQQISAYFNLAWDDVDELKRLAEISAPRVVIDTAGLTPRATELANRLAERIAALDGATLAEILRLLDRRNGEGS
jgi:transcriptional regulator with XRE-family HTH domain